MWDRHESDSINELYSKIDIDHLEVAKCFTEMEWFAIVYANHAKNVSYSTQWYRIPKTRKMTSVARFQFLIYDQGQKDGTDRWRNFFKQIIKQLHIHPNRTNIVQIGFSLLAVHPLKLAKNKPNAHVYVSCLFLLCLIL